MATISSLNSVSSPAGSHDKLRGGHFTLGSSMVGFRGGSQLVGVTLHMSAAEGSSCLWLAVKTCSACKIPGSAAAHPLPRTHPCRWQPNLTMWQLKALASSHALHPDVEAHMHCQAHRLAKAQEGQEGGAKGHRHSHVGWGPRVGGACAQKQRACLH